MFLSIIFLNILFLTCAFSQDRPKNILLIGWDGVQKECLLELLKRKQLPHTQGLIDEGRFLEIRIDVERGGHTKTKPGWAKILSGYGAEITGVYQNKYYKPILEGYTIFERLKEYFGPENIKTVFLAGKERNLGARGAHKICLNCPHYWDEKLFMSMDSIENKNIVIREGEPYMFAKKHIDFFENGLGDARNVGWKALKYLDKIKNNRFLMFVHFWEPDEIGHIYGGNSKEYSMSIVENDKWLGKLIAKLKKINIYDDTSIYLTTDHGFCEGMKEHLAELCSKEATDIFLITNDKAVTLSNGEIKDIAATILAHFEVPLGKLKPPLEGVSLIEPKGK